MHGEHEPHVTVTFGTRTITPRLMGMTLRIKPERDVLNVSDEEKRRLVKLVERWLIRRADRHGYTFAAMQGGPIGHDKNPDAFAVMWLEIDTIPDDWLCFSSMAWRVMASLGGSVMPFKVVGLDQLMEMPGFGDDEEGPTDDAEIKVGGRAVEIGTTRRRTH